MALGLGVVASVISLEWASSRSGRLLAAQVQMAEDAQIGLQLLSAELMMAGYARPVEVTSSPGGQARWKLAQAAPPILACDGGFASPTASGTPVCANALAVGGSAALAVRYQADEHNTMPLSGTLRPSDCLGNGLDTSAGGSYLADNRWYVAASQGRSELRCAARDGQVQPLVDNVESLALWFSQALAVDPLLPVRYVRAAGVSDFALVRSVRLCLLMRSTDAVLEPGMPATYQDCEGQSRSAPDRRLRQAFHTTVALRTQGVP